jgi:tetratricopeptide (TPR) repeat protein
MGGLRADHCLPAPGPPNRNPLTRRRRPREHAKSDAQVGKASAEISPVNATHTSNADLGATMWRLIPLLLVVAGLFAYHNSFEGAFLLDDQPRIVDNVQIRELWPPWKAMAESSRPFLQVSLALNYAISGVDPWGYHALNVAIHILAGILLFGVVRRMLVSDKLEVRYRGTAQWLALAVSTVWLVHPLQTESITYIIQRAESLMGMLFLLTLYCGIRACSSPHPHRWSIGAITACVLGMGTKEVMVSAPLLMLLYDYVFVSGSLRRALRLRGWLYAGLAATWLVLAISLATSRAEEQMMLVAGIDPLRYAWTQCEVILHYLRLSLWPHPLVFDYAWQTSGSLSSVLPSVAIVLALLAGTVVMLVRRIWWGFWGAWFFLILGPTSSIMPIADVAVEHRMYLPLAAVVVVIIIGGHDLLGFIGRKIGAPANLRRGLEAGLVGAIVVTLGVATARRNDDYRSAIAMWSDTVAKRPDNPRAHNNLGVALTNQGKSDEAITHYAEAVRLKPDYVDARNNLGTGFMKQGRYDDAIAEYKEAVRVRPSFAEAHSNLGIALMRSGRNDEAAAEFSRALSLNPGSSRTHNDLGTILYRQGRMKEAAAQYSAAIRLQPGFAEAHHNLGLAVLEQGNTDAAIAHFTEAIRLKPDYAKARNNLGILFHQQGRIKEAVAQFAEAARLDPTFAEAKKNLEAAGGTR